MSETMTNIFINIVNKKIYLNELVMMVIDNQGLSEYLEDESVEEEANGREEESEEREEVEIFVNRVRFMGKVNGIESVNEIHSYYC